MGLSVVSRDDQPDRGQYGPQDRSRRFWTVPKDNPVAVASAVKAWMDSIEKVNWVRRWNNLVYFRYMTGRTTGPMSYNFSSTSRPSSCDVYGRARFEPPRLNEIMRCSDALANRVYRSRPFLQVCPIDGDSNARFDAKYITQFMDAAFFDLDLWTLVEQAGFDCRTWGDGFLKVDADIHGNAIKVTRLISDEIMVDENECNVGSGDVRNLGIRLFVSKDEMTAFAESTISDEAERAKACRAIQSAPKSNNGFYFGRDIDYTDVIVLREVWHGARNGGKGHPLNKGRHILSVGTYVFVDEEYEYESAPIARLPFKRSLTGYFSRGMPEMALGLQREIDRTMAAIWENMRRAAWPRIGIFEGSNVDPAKLGDRSNGIYKVAGGPSMAPKFDFPVSVRPEQFQHLADTIRRVDEMFRLNENAIDGTDNRLTSGIAKAKQQEINDVAHADLNQNLEDFVEDLGHLLVRAAEKCKPKVTLPGRHAQLINWADLNWDSKSFYLRPFPVGRLSQSLPYRQQQIDTWAAEGAISKQTKMRLEQVPDTDGYETLANASPDFTFDQLDHIVEFDEYEPPEPFGDLQEKMATAQSRYLLERRLQRRLNTPQSVLDKLLMYISQLDEMISGVSAATAPAPGSNITDQLAAGQAPAPGMPGPAGVGPGIAPPAGPAPAPAPYPMAPGMPAPAPA